MRSAILMASAALLFPGSGFAADDLKSGPQKPTVVVKAFNTLHCNGEGAGTKACLV